MMNNRTCNQRAAKKPEPTFRADAVNQCRFQNDGNYEHKEDHTKKYLSIDGQMVTLSFAEQPNRKLYDKVYSILLKNSKISITSNCGIEGDCDRIEADVP